MYSSSYSSGVTGVKAAANNPNLASNLILKNYLMQNSIILHSTPISDFKKIIGDVMREQLIGMLHTEKEPEPLYITRKDVADRLQISLISVDKYAKQGILKSYRIGGAIRFKSGEVDKALEEVRNAKYRRA